MKSIKILSILLASAALSVSCNNNPQNDPGTPSMTVTPTELEFDSEAVESKTLKVVSNRDWKVSENLEEIGWISLSVDGKSIDGKVVPASANPVEVVVTVQKNSEYERMQKLTFNGGTRARASVTVSQAGGESFNTIKEVLDAFVDSGQDTLVVNSMVVKATVVSNIALDNLNSSKSMYIQDETAGVNVFCSSNHSCAFGDNVQINLSGVKVFKYAGAPEFSGVEISAIRTISTGNTVEPMEISASEIAAYEGRYVKINDVQVTEADRNKTWVQDSKATSINMETRTGESFVVRSGKYSKYGAETVLDGSGSICGLATTYNGAAQIIFAQDSDRKDLNGERFQKETPLLTIAQIIAKGSGDVETVARVIELGTAGFVINDGGDKNLYVYTESAPEVEKGDIVDIIGSLTTYGKALEIKPVTIEPSTEVVPETPEQTPEELTDAEIGAFENDGSAELVSFTGILKISGKNVNIELSGIEKPQGSVQSDTDLSGYEGQRVKVTGYFSGKTTNWFTIILKDIEVSTEPFLTINPSGSKNVSASVKSLEINVASNVEWTCSSTNDDFVPSTPSGSGSDKVTVSFPENTDPDNEKTATIKFSYEGGEESLVITQAKYKPVVGSKFVKVHDLSDLSGDFLIVCEAAGVAFDGSKTSFPGTLSGIAVTIEEEQIEVTDKLKESTVSFEPDGSDYDVKLASGYYITNSTEKNNIDYSSKAALCKVSFEDSSTGDVQIMAGDGLSILRYNSNKDQQVFKFFKKSTYTNQKPIQLYRLSE